MTSSQQNEGVLSMPEAFLIGGARTPVGRYGGALSSVRPDDLAALTVEAAVERAGIDPHDVDEVILGNANGAGEENRNVARMAWLLAGFPDTVPGITVNRLCASGLSAIIMASHMIKAGAADIVVAGGVESMSRAPWVMEKPAKAFAKPGDVFDTSIGWRFPNPTFLSGELSREGKATYSMPETAEEVARVFGTSREDCDAFAVRSHEKATAAIEAGRFAGEIVPVTITDRKGAETVVDTDEGPRPGTSLDVLAGLRPVVKGGSVVTAGNASTLNDGASAIIVASERAVEKYGLVARARIAAGASAGVSQEVMGIGPVPATRKVLERAGITVGDLGAVELNEAFASQSLACMRELGLDPGTVNNDGGAIALGHPLGSSGSRLVVTLLGRMEREGADRGLATMCVGVGQGTAMLVEKL
jgi:3-oxoadipyl-CoA thiolase